MTWPENLKVVNCISVRLDSSSIQPLVDHIESPTVILLHDGFSSLDHEWFHGQFPRASPSNSSLPRIAERLILEERRQPLSSVPNAHCFQSWHPYFRCHRCLEHGSDLGCILVGRKCLLKQAQVRSGLATPRTVRCRRIGWHLRSRMLRYAQA